MNIFLRYTYIHIHIHICILYIVWDDDDDDDDDDDGGPSVGGHFGAEAALAVRLIQGLPR